MKLISTVIGTIIHRELVEPENKKPFFKYQVLQSIEGQKANLIDVKDRSIDRHLTGDIEIMCEIMDWNFNGKSGMSVNVLEPINSKKTKSEKQERSLS